MKFKTNKKIILLILVCVSISYSFQDKFFEIAKQIEIYNNLFKTLNKEYIEEINPGELTNKAINNTLANFDPYTRFYNEQQMEDAKIKREGEYAGIGISTWYIKKGIIVADVKENQPADKAGIKTGDIIIEVNGQLLADMENIQKREVLKGTPNTKINLVLERNKKILNLDVTLDKIDIKAVPFFGMINTETGYIKLNRFINKKATNQVRNAFIKLEEQGMKKLVFDLRDNPGGSLYDAINITNLFIEKDKKVVHTKGKTKRNSRVYKTKNLPLNLNIPIVVLISNRSASASEIVSGALQDYDRGVIIGDRSFGKGLVQRYFKLNYGTQMKATISKYYTPSGRCIQELDYANRNSKTGKVPKFSEGKINEFKTTNGRKVYDGGGVMPDIKIHKTKNNEKTEKLIKSRAIFNFANEYLLTHPIAEKKTFKFSKEDFNTFKKFLISKDTSFISNEESLFKKAFKSVKNNKEINSNYNAIITRLKQNKVDEISKNEDFITEKINKEILRRYFYEKGMYEYLLKNDTTIKKAVSILENENQYNKLLKK